MRSDTRRRPPSSSTGSCVGMRQQHTGRAGRTLGLAKSSHGCVRACERAGDDQGLPSASSAAEAVMPNATTAYMCVVHCYEPAVLDRLRDPALGCSRLLRSFRGHLGSGLARPARRRCYECQASCWARTMPACRQTCPAAAARSRRPSAAHPGRMWPPESGRSRGRPCQLCAARNAYANTTQAWRRVSRTHNSQGSTRKGQERASM
jgi:hypothetical protein